MRSTLALIFFLSGASALVFESLWFRLAGLSLGNSVWSASLVLAAFMGGLALGNGIVAMLHRRVSYPVRLYAVLEFTIGIGGLIVVLLMPRLPELLGPFLGNLTATPAGLNAVRLAIAFGVLLVPATAMGATLPVLVKALSRQERNFGANIGWLYGWNTLGATLAAFGTELLLVPALGILNSGLFALALNLVAALVALRVSQMHEIGPAPVRDRTDRPGTISNRGRRYLAVAFLSGALMLALEVVWFRFMLLTRSGTSFLFGVMLAVVLAGIAIGGFAAARLFRHNEHGYHWLRHVTSASAVMVVLTYWAYDLFAVYENVYAVSTPKFIGLAVFLMFPVSVLSGVAFTMVNRAVKNELGSSARTTGIATLFNTIGAMLGSLAAGFVLLPLAGMELSFFLIAAAYCLVAIIVPVEDRAPQFSKAWSHGSFALAALCLVLFPFGLMQSTHFDDEIAMLPNHELVASHEGLTETSRYYREEVFGETHFYRLVTNSFSMSATSTAAKRYMKLYVYLPLAFNPDTEDALLISFGVGSTAKALTDTGSLKRIDIVDISEDILELSEIVYPDSDNPLRDERVRVHVEDGRFFLNATSNRYDLITSEPPPPKHAGVVNLYSQEYFELIHNRLNPGGYVSYWLPVQQLEAIETLAIIKGFCNAFDDCSLWTGAGMDWMLLGSNDATSRVSVSQFSAQWSDPSVGQELVALGLESPAELGSLFVADSAFLTALTADVAPVTDNYPSRISSHQVDQQRFVELYANLLDEGERLERFRESDFIDQIWPAEFKNASEPFFEYERLMRSHFFPGVYVHQADPYVWEAIDDLLTNSSRTTLPLWLLGSDQDTQDVVARLLAEQGYRDDFALELARKHALERDYEAALRHAQNYISAAEEVTDIDMQFYLYLLAKNGLMDQARPILAQLEVSGGARADRFSDWFARKFEQESTENTDQQTMGAQ